jgi:SSS family solute:Na+ symporter
VVKNGIAAFMMQVAIIPAALVVIPIFIPFFMRLRFTSAYEYLEHRFDYRTRLVGGGLFLLLKTGWVALVMYTGSLALSAMTGWDLFAVILVLGVAATLYTCLGGLEGVVWTDVLQAVMLFGGAGAIVLHVWLTTGDGPLAWWEAAGRYSAAHTRPAWFSVDPFERMTLGTALIAGFSWQVCTHCSDQVVLQRYAATPSLGAAIRSYLINVAAVLSITSLLLVSGLALLYFYVRHPELLPSGARTVDVGDRLMPHFFAHQLPLGFGGLILANFLCDAMQTLVSGVNSITAVASQDVLEHSRWARKKVHHRLATARRLTFLMGLVTTLIALGVARLAQGSKMNITDLMPPAFNVFLGPLGALFLIGLFQPRATARTALCAVGAALLVSVLWNYDTLLFGKDFDLSVCGAIFVPCLCGVTSGFVLSLILDNGGDHPGRRFTWWAVMRRPSLHQE